MSWCGTRTPRRFRCARQGAARSPSLSLSLPLFLSLSLSFSLCLSLCVCVCVSGWVGVHLSFSVSVDVSLCRSLPPCLSLALALSLSLSLSLYIHIHIYLPLSRAHRTIYTALQCSSWGGAGTRQDPLTFNSAGIKSCTCRGTATLETNRGWSLAISCGPTFEI